MSILEDYFVGGRDVDQIVAQGHLEPDVRNALREGGITLSRDDVQDCVTAAVRRLGYLSFASFVRDNQLSSLRDQARTLGVSRHALAKIYDAYRQFVVAEHSNG